MFHESPYPLAITKPSEILLELEPIGGLYRPNINRPEPKSVFKNKPVSNMGKLLHILYTASSQTLKDTGGGSWSLDTGLSIYLGSSNPVYNSFHRPPSLINFGIDPTPPTLSDYELKNRITDTGTPAFILPPIYETNRTRLRFYSRYYLPVGYTVKEAGLYLRTSTITFMLTRAVIPDGLQRNEFTQYEDGYEIVLPANYTTNFAELIHKYLTADASNLFGNQVIATDRSKYVIRRGVTSPDLVIGSDNTPPSPSDYYLKGTVYGSLSSQSASYEEDTTLQEIRSIRVGTITPTSNITVGEIALTLGVYDHTGATRRIMIARGTWTPAIQLQSGTTYTLGIVLKLS